MEDRSTGFLFKGGTKDYFLLVEIVFQMQYILTNSGTNQMIHQASDALYISELMKMTFL
jgi:hypothetical protein